ncbi:hypothetical protein KCU88_g5936, partial [Aureobasidium melanogenum]
MSFTISLPPLPPPSTSLLPPVTNAASDLSNLNPPSAPYQNASRRQKSHAATASRNSTLALLSADERTIAQRKMAIAMYGYSWLKPAGCAKTMLGRREEELEREEVEKQLREVELQERLQQEAEEQDRLAQLGETGEPEGERDLDEEIPDADGGADAGGLSDEYEDVEEDDGMQGDLDDEIPDADAEEDEDEDDEDDEIMSPDPTTVNAEWVYDTRREPDTDEEDVPPSPVHASRVRMQATASVAGVYVGSDYGQDERDAQDLASAMIDEDEIFDERRDDPSNTYSGGERDLDDDVPEAESDQAWEHTDTELEESEIMDISILPPSGVGSRQIQQRDSLESTEARLGLSGRRITSTGAGSTRVSTRRSSGPWIAEPSTTATATSAARAETDTHPRARMFSGNQSHSHSQSQSQLHYPQHQHQYSHQQQHQYSINQTPGILDSPVDGDNTGLGSVFSQGLGAAAAAVQGGLNVDPDLGSDPFASSVPRVTRSTSTHFTRGAMFRRDVHAPAAPPEEELPSSSPDRPGQRTNANPTTTTENPATRATAARNWLDGAAAAVGGSARRTLFGRTAARRGAAATTNSASGGLFTPSPATGQQQSHRAAGAAAAAAAAATTRAAQQEWETPINNAGNGHALDSGQTSSQNTTDANQRETRSRSGRFLGGRSRRER